MLSHPSFIRNITVDHPSFPSTLAKAPRKFVVWGVVDGEANMERYSDSSDIIHDLWSRVGANGPMTRNEDRDLQFVPLASVFYNIRAEQLFQTFQVFPEITRLDMDFGIVVIQILGNWGDSFTACHHMGIYGEQAEVVG